MSKVLTQQELKAMSKEDLLREINKQYRAVAKLRLAVKSGSEKGYHLLKKERTQLARMLTVYATLSAS